MASGLGVRGTTGRCFGFFADFKDCTKELKAEAKLNKPKNDEESLEFLQKMNEKRETCGGIREDYFECLHGVKERARVQAIVLEKERQEYEAKHGAKAH